MATNPKLASERWEVAPWTPLDARYLGQSRILFVDIVPALL